MHLSVLVRPFLLDPLREHDREEREEHLAMKNIYCHHCFFVLHRTNSANAFFVNRFQLIPDCIGFDLKLVISQRN